MCATSVLQQKKWEHMETLNFPRAKEFEVCYSVFCNAEEFSHVKLMHRSTTTNVNIVIH
jgi:hypothetical protein